MNKQMATQGSADWNQMIGWLREVGLLRDGVLPLLGLAANPTDIPSSAHSRAVLEPGKPGKQEGCETAT